MKRLPLKPRERKGTNVPKYILRAYKQYLSKRHLNHELHLLKRVLKIKNSSIKKVSRKDINVICKSKQQRRLLKEALHQELHLRMSLYPHGVHYGGFVLKFMLRLQNNMQSECLDIK